MNFRARNVDFAKRKYIEIEKLKSEKDSSSFTLLITQKIPVLLTEIAIENLLLQGHRSKNVNFLETGKSLVSFEF